MAVAGCIPADRGRSGGLHLPVDRETAKKLRRCPGKTKERQKEQSVMQQNKAQKVIEEVKKHLSEKQSAWKSS